MREVMATSLTITVFVAAAMLLVEYLHLMRPFRTEAPVRRGIWSEHVIAALLGATPGCLGVFAVAFALFVVVSAPEHFLEEHLWNHILKKHLPAVFLWTLGSLTAIHVLLPTPGAQQSLNQQPWALLVIECALGLLPQSGPHLVLVMLYSQGLVPLSVLIANSVVQDGHGMLPLLALSRIDFLLVKLINLGAGLALGVILMASGW